MRIRLLRKALSANVGFSTITGVIAVVMGDQLEELLGPPDWTLRSLGAGLLVFAALVASQVKTPQERGTRLIIAADAGWVATATVVLAFTPTWLTATGRVVLGLVSVVVAALAIAQWRGLGAENTTVRSRHGEASRPIGDRF